MAWIGAAIAAVAAIATAIISSESQKKQNRELARFQADANEKYLREQQEYNSPASQMARFQAAGLNKHLIYGQGNPGNQSAPLTYPEIKPVDLSQYSHTVSNLVPLINQTRLADSQVQAQNAATQQKYAQAELQKLQAEVLAKNPALNDEGYKAMIQSLITTVS